MDTIGYKTLTITSLTLSISIRIVSYFLTLRILRRVKLTETLEDQVFENEDSLKKNITIQWNTTIFYILGEILSLLVYCLCLFFKVPETSYYSFEWPFFRYIFCNMWYVLFFHFILTSNNFFGNLYFAINSMKDNEEQNLYLMCTEYYNNLITKTPRTPKFLFYMTSALLTYYVKKYTLIVIWIDICVLHFLSRKFSVYNPYTTNGIIISKLQHSLLLKVQSIFVSENIKITDLLIKKYSDLNEDSISSLKFRAYNANKIIMSEYFLEILTEDEVISVLYHQIYHYKHSKAKMISILEFILITFKFSMFFAFQKLFLYELEMPRILIWVYFIGFISSFNLIIDMIYNVFKRIWENEADEYAVIKTKSKNMESALKKIYSFNRTDIYCSKLEELVKSDCYALPRRLKRIRATYEIVSAVEEL